MASSERGRPVYEPTDLDRADVLRLLAHDIKNPLTTVRVLAEMLLEDADPTARRDLADIVEAVDLAAVTADALADLGRLEAGDEPTWVPDEIDLAEVVREVADRDAFASVTSVDPESAGRARADEGAASRVMVALLLNGRRMIGPDARLQVRVRDHVVHVEHPGVSLGQDDCSALLSLYGGARLKARRVRAAALGLGYVGHVIEGIGGSVEVASGPRGLDVRVTFLPARPEPPGIG